jgi:hypothetical protein
MMRKLLLIAACALLFTQAQSQSIPFPQPSPTATISQNFATTKIELSYSRPSAKGRKVFGNVVPFGKVWRTGANGATTIQFHEDVKVNGTEVKSGKYGLLSIPGENEWVVIITKDLDVTSPDAYKQENDVVRVNVKVGATKDYTETFTIELNNMRLNECRLNIKWEQTIVSLDITADYDAKISKQIETVMAKDTRPYFGAANYYYENHKDLNQALTWVNKAIEANPKAYWVWLLKAKIQKDMKNYAGAMESSAKSMELAKADGDDAYIKNNENLQADIKAMPDYVAPKAKKK